MLLSQAEIGYTGWISKITGDERLQLFLSTLGCYPGEKIKLISILAGNYIVSIKDSRYAVDKTMADMIRVVDHIPAEVGRV